jgi:hypothetical protein
VRFPRYIDQGLNHIGGIGAGGAETTELFEI